jgi:hypothetical protein
LNTGMPHTSCEQRSPGFTHVPQLALQQTCPGAHWAEPHVTVAGAADADGPAEALAAALVSAGTPFAPAAPFSPTSIGGPTWSTISAG